MKLFCCWLAEKSASLVPLQQASSNPTNAKTAVSEWPIHIVCYARVLEAIAASKMPRPNTNPPYPLITYRAPLFRVILAMLEDTPCQNLNLSNVIDYNGWQGFVSFLAQDGLASIFYTHLSENPSPLPDEQAIKDALRVQSLVDAARYLSQKSTLTKIHRAFETAGIKYAVFKGAHVRESAYPQSWLRPSVDIDVLIAKTDQARAIAALKNAGMQYHPDPEVLSHEATFSNSDTAVDLHWHIMRPGRTRIDMTEYLLEDAEFSHGYWGMNPTAMLFVLLTHPAINKYVCSPDATLIKVLDLYLWMKRADIDHDQLYYLINTAGLKTAAWSMLFLLSLLVPEMPYSEIQSPDIKSPEIQSPDKRYLDKYNKTLFEKLKPGYLQRKYIMFWVSRDLPTLFYNYRFLMRTAFSLSLHDNIPDMIRAIRQLGAYKAESKQHGSAVK